MDTSSTLNLTGTVVLGPNTTLVIHEEGNVTVMGSFVLDRWSTLNVLTSNLALDVKGNAVLDGKLIVQFTGN